jgi:GNAT superfamily N-acetyltransferase
MIPPHLTIRQATEADYEQICDLMTVIALARPERLAIARTIAGPRSAILVACERDARILHGLATLAATASARIETLIVREASRGQGIGRALAERAAEWSLRKGYGPLDVSAAREAVSPQSRPHRDNSALPASSRGQARRSGAESARSGG